MNLFDKLILTDLITIGRKKDKDLGTGIRETNPSPNNPEETDTRQERGLMIRESIARWNKLTEKNKNTIFRLKGLLKTFRGSITQNLPERNTQEHASRSAEPIEETKEPLIRTLWGVTKVSNLMTKRIKTDESGNSGEITKATNQKPILIDLTKDSDEESPHTEKFNKLFRSNPGDKKLGGSFHTKVISLRL